MNKLQQELGDTSDERLFESLRDTDDSGELIQEQNGTFDVVGAKVYIGSKIQKNME
jgi:hypothetical protein